ncbi:MAG: transcriptional repressor [Myxococcaceae bacterium]
MFKTAIHKAGLRSTPARIAVLTLLSQAKKPMSHGELADCLQAEEFDRATIFRNLTDLTEAGLLSRIDLGDHTWRFELKAQHPHFVCTDCGDVACLSDSDIQVSTKLATISEVLLKGHCGECL